MEGRPVRIRTLGPAIGLAALLAGCATPAPTTTHAVLLCDGAQTISVDFTNGSAVLKAGAVSARLTQQPSGSGIHYAGEGHDLRGKGRDVTWTDAAGTVHQCHDQR